jgi:hypothetical protein
MIKQEIIAAIQLAWYIARQLPIVALGYIGFIALQLYIS